jgi:hypothetical protein
MIMREHGGAPPGGSSIPPRRDKRNETGDKAKLVIYDGAEARGRLRLRRR